MEAGMLYTLWNLLELFFISNGQPSVEKMGHLNWFEIKLYVIDQSLYSNLV